MREMSSAYSYRRVYSSLATPASTTNRTWLAYPSSYSSVTSTDFTAPAHSGYRGKSQMTAATRSGGAVMTIDWVDVSAIAEDYRPASRLEPGHLRRESLPSVHQPTRELAERPSADARACRASISRRESLPSVHQPTRELAERPSADARACRASIGSGQSVHGEVRPGGRCRGVRAEERDDVG